MFVVHIDFTPWCEDDPTFIEISKSSTWRGAHMSVVQHQCQGEFYAGTWYSIGPPGEPFAKIFRNENLPLPTFDTLMNGRKNFPTSMW